jgi:hypothetical protein
MTTPAKGDMPAGPTLQLISYDDGIDTEEEWSQSREGKDRRLMLSRPRLPRRSPRDAALARQRPHAEATEGWTVRGSSGP